VDVFVRYGEEGDLQRVAALDKSVNIEHLNWKLQANEIILAETQSGLIGYLRLERLWSKYPYIGLIFVDREYQRRGIGKKLLHFLEMDLISQGSPKLYSSSQANEPEPQAWHRHMGFQECGILNGINEGDIGEIFFMKSLEGRYLP